MSAFLGAGLVSFYESCVMCEFGEYVKMFDYTKTAVFDILFNDCENYSLLPSPEWTDDFIPWKEININANHKMKPNTKGYEIINGNGIVKGHLLGGYIDVFMTANGTDIWFSTEQ